MKLLLLCVVCLINIFIFPQSAALPKKGNDTTNEKQNTYLMEGSIGNKKKVISEDKGLFSFVPFERWTGKKFMVLPQSKNLRKYGYQDFGASYEELCGHIIQVTTVDGSGISAKVSFVDLNTGDKYNDIRSFDETVHDICLLRDLDNAKSFYEGKKIWYRNRSISTYDENTDKFASIELTNLCPLEIKKIVAGWYEHEPIRFIFETEDGQTGFCDFNLSDTNVGGILKGGSKPEESFFMEDPFAKYNYDAKTWEAVKNRRIFIGMSKEQVVLSWGEPNEINRTNTQHSSSEQWVYANYNYVYFENNLVTSIQN